MEGVYSLLLPWLRSRQNRKRWSRGGSGGTAFEVQELKINNEMRIMRVFTVTFKFKYMCVI